MYDQRHQAASANLARARSEAKLYAAERRKAIHDQVAEIERRRAEKAVEQARDLTRTVDASKW